jgi:hypothetical protein
MQLTKGEDSTNVQSAEKHLGCKEGDLLQKVFTSSKNYLFLIIFCSYFLVFVTIFIPKKCEKSFS